MSDRRPLIVIAPDSLKGSCTSPEAAAAVAAGAREARGDAVRVVELPMADGGEGTLDALAAAWGGRIVEAATRDALGRARHARLGINADGTTAIIEAAEANGLPHVADRDPRPLDADTYGVGLLALAALDAGAREILLSVGGSATSDGGAGFLRALGVRLQDADGRDVAGGAAGLRHLDRIDVSGLHPAAREARWRIAVDVDNPLIGPRGAAAVFGPQKGASPDDVRAIDAALKHFAAVLSTMLAERSSRQGSGDANRPEEATGGPASAPSAGAGHDGPRAPSRAELTERPGLGAAGGLPLAAVALLGAETVPGAELVAQAVGLDAALSEASLVITGEGRLDSQSLDGKVVSRVVAGAGGVPVVVIAGALDLTAEACREAGIAAAFSIARGPATLDELSDLAPELLAEAAAHICGAFFARW